jgi:hypothetical protein
MLGPKMIPILTLARRPLVQLEPSRGMGSALADPFLAVAAFSLVQRPIVQCVKKFASGSLQRFKPKDLR